MQNENRVRREAGRRPYALQRAGAARRRWAVGVIAVLCCLGLTPTWAAKCLFVSSYHQGYAWADGVERGLRRVLDGRCELRQFDMDSKRHKSDVEKRASARAAKSLIDEWKPDVVITADDNAARYLIQDFYRDHRLPFVFCGVNWTVAEYGFPYSNVTGMIEIAPIRPLLARVKAIFPAASRVIYIGANTLTEKKNLARFQQAAVAEGLELDARLVDTADEWLAAYRRAQEYDYIIMGSNSGIRQWDDRAVAEAIVPMTRRLSVTNHGWMMPYSMLGYTKVPEEQGEWAAEAALRIIAGTRPADIPIVPNHKWDIWTNTRLLEAADIALPRDMLAASHKVP
ncbi:MAG: hypothetical protein KDJ27_14430 [Gammaproteobacteria bacterium]|nr:hypothetical protein [Gammaproteobacteria bacterium]